MRRGRGNGTVLVVLLVASACGRMKGAGDSPGTAVTGATPAPAELVRRTATATAAAGTARFVTEVAVGSPRAAAVAARGEGMVDFAATRGIRRDAANDALSGVGGPDRLSPIAVVWTDGDTSRQQEINDGHPGRVTQVAGGLGSLLGLDTQVKGGAADILEAEIDDVGFLQVGHGAVRGTPATHFRSTGGEPGASTLDLWVDGRGRLVRLARFYPQGHSGAGTNTLDLYDFGATLDIPPAPAVTENP